MVVKDILLVNPPLIFSVLEHAGDDLETINLVIEDNLISSMNVGLITIGSYLKSKGYSVTVIDLYREKDLSKLESELRLDKYRFAGISCVTGYSYLASQECCRAVKRLSPDTVTVGGGAHIGPLGVIALKECAELDIVARYEGELVLEQLLDGTPVRRIPGLAYRSDETIHSSSEPGPLIDLNLLPPFDFTLYPDYQDYMPFVEESRGCYSKCSYCVNCFLNQGKIRIKKATKFLQDLDAAVAIYGRERSFIFESLTFGANVKNTIALLTGVKERQVNWSVEFRVDSPWQKYLRLMHEAGCRMIDVGLESASPRILELMYKTQKPKSYIASASDLIRQATRYPDLFVSYNILFFLGENPASIKETTSFIFSHQHPRVMISAFPVFLFPGVPLWHEVKRFEKDYGSQVLSGGFWSKCHIYPADLSHSISFMEALVFSKILQRMFYSQPDAPRKSLKEKNGSLDWEKLFGGDTCAMSSLK